MIPDAPVRFLLILASDESDVAPNRDMRVARIAPPYYLFKDLSVEVVLATPLGGFPAMCEDLPPSSAADDATRRFMADRGARDDLADTLSLQQIVVEDFDAAFCIGFAGSIWDGDNLGVASVIKAFLTSRKPLALVPGSDLDVAPDGAGAGLLIVGDSEESSLLAAHALIKVVQEQRRLRDTDGPVSGLSR